MKILDLIKDYFLGYSSFFYFRNFIEVIFFATIIYYFSLWLKKDSQKNLLSYFYIYCLILLVAYYTQLTTISHFMFLFSPVAAMIFISLHQSVLQRNFIALKNISPAKYILSEWPEELIRSCLVAINNNKKIHCILENHNSMEDFIRSPLVLNANLKQTVVKILLESIFFDQSKMLWINTNGKLIAINAEYKKEILQELDNENLKQPWKKNAILLSSKTDALFLRITPSQRTFEIIFDGKVIDNIKASNALNIIKKYAASKFFIKEKSLAKGELIHEANAKKNSFKQSTN